MNDQKLRELLGDLADEASRSRTVPPDLERRVHRRVALNSVAVGTLVIALGVGTFGVVRALAPASKSSIAPLTSSPAVPRCTSGQLRAVGSMSGAAGSRIGYIELRNYSDVTCTLSGTPVIGLYENGTRINTRLLFNHTVAQWQADAAPRPAGWPVVTLGKMGSTNNAARVRISWSNWCPQGRAFPLWRVFIPNSDSVDVVAGIEQAGAPPCNGAPLPSTVEVGPFEPAP